MKCARQRIKKNVCPVFKEVIGLKEVIGFVGECCYDIMLLLAKTMSCFNEKVLLVDRNVYHTLSVSVPIPEGISPGKQIVSYDDLFYTEAELKEEFLNRYDYILIDFGMVLHRDIEKCSVLFMISGSMPHQIRQAKELCIPKNRVRGVVIRDLLRMSQKEGKELKEFVSGFQDSRLFFMKQDHLDRENCLVYETAYEYRLSNASEQMQEVIFGLYCTITFEKNEKEFWRTIKKRERKGFL